MAHWWSGSTRGMNTIRAGKAVPTAGFNVSSVVWSSPGYCALWALGLSGVFSGVLWAGYSGVFSSVERSLGVPRLVGCHLTQLGCLCYGVREVLEWNCLLQVKVSGLARGNAGIARECTLRQSLQTVVNFLPGDGAFGCWCGFFTGEAL